MFGWAALILRSQTGRWYKFAATRPAGLGRANRREDAECPWLNPELVAQIESVQWTEGDHRRHPRWVALRDDKDLKEAGRGPRRKSNEPMLNHSPLQGSLPVEVFYGYVMRAFEIQRQQSR